MVSSTRLLRVPPVERGLTLGDFLVPIRISERMSARVRNAMLVAIGTYKVFARSSAGVTRSHAVVVPVAPEPSAHPESRLELLSLDHRTTSAGFVVTGRLRNPPDGASLQNVIAVIDVLDRDGRVLATASAPIKQAVLNAGDSSEFLVAAADAPKVAR